VRLLLGSARKIAARDGRKAPDPGLNPRGIRADSFKRVRKLRVDFIGMEGVREAGGRYLYARRMKGGENGIRGKQPLRYG
jgi:hypothetical protein